LLASIEGLTADRPGYSRGMEQRTRADAIVHGVRQGPSPDETPRPSQPAEPPIAVLDGAFVKVHADEHPLPLACEVAVYFQDYYRSSSKLGRFAKIVGIDELGDEYLLMLDNFESVSVPMRRVEWRKKAT
jgi:hypothetical protein